MKEFLKSEKIRLGGLFVGLFLLATGLTWAAFTLTRGGGPVKLVSPVGLETNRSRIDPNAPKTESCPLNGRKYTKAEKDIWDKRRPLTVMIENHQEARPQSGLTKADVVYEAVAEGGITRFLAVFYCGASADDLIIGPVRSARIYFIDWASEYGDYPLYAHVGGANRAGPADALGKIADLGWLPSGGMGNDLNQFAIGFPAFWRDYERIGHPVATEHTMYGSTDKLWNEAKDRELTDKNKKGDRWDALFKGWQFAEGKPTKPVSSISFPFWSGQPEYAVKWIWDSATNLWKRENGGVAQTDLNTKEQLQASTVIIQFAQERALRDPEKHMLYTTTGTGKALVFTNGGVVSGTWQKKDRQNRTVFLDASGKEIAFVPGQIWVEVVPAGTQVTYNSIQENSELSARR